MAVFRAAHLPLVDPVLHGEVTLKYGLLLEGRTDLSLGVRKREGKRGRERREGEPSWYHVHTIARDGYT